jgi:hypothetical protein
MLLPEFAHWNLFLLKKNSAALKAAAEYNPGIATGRDYLAPTRRRTITIPASPKPTNAIVTGSGTNSIELI